MNRDLEDYLLDVQDRLDNDEEVTENEILIYMSACIGTPVEVLEARLSMIRGEELLILDEDLEMTGKMSLEEWENNEELDYEDEDD